jgi:class 3 adenylate cyclase
MQKHAQAGQALVDEHTYQAVQDIIVADSIETLQLDEGDGLVQVYQVIAVKEPGTV